MSTQGSTNDVGFPLYAVIATNEYQNCFGPIARKNLGRKGTRN